MNILDGAIIIILAYCVIRGIFRGLIKEIFSLVGLLGGFFAASSYYLWLAKLLSRWLANTGYLSIMSFMIIFFVVFIVVSILGVIINYVLKIPLSGWINRISGAAFGTVRGMLLVTVLLIPLISFLPKGVPVLKDSHLVPYITLASEKMTRVVSQDLRKAFTDNVAILKKIRKKKI